MAALHKNGSKSWQDKSLSFSITPISIVPNHTRLSPSCVASCPSPSMQVFREDCSCIQFASFILVACIGIMRSVISVVIVAVMRVSALLIGFELDYPPACKRVSERGQRLR